MEKTRSTIYMLIISITIFFTVFYYTCFSSCAEIISGEEVFLTHKHNDSCYRTTTECCEGSHYVYQHGVEYGDYHCHNCGHYTQHIIEADNWSCPYFNVGWQENGVVKCTVCGTIHGTWSNSAPGNHTYQTRNLICGIPEGQKDVGIKISADSTWTNQTVKLQSNINILNHNYTNDMINSSWGSNDMIVSENGNYSVTVIGLSGNTATASISINCIDKIAPVINNVNADTQNMTADTITLTVSALDNESGLCDAPYSFDGGNSYCCSNSVSVNKGVEIQCVVKDKAGNTTSRVLRRSDYPYPEAVVVTPPIPVETPEKEQGKETKSESKNIPAGESSSDNKNTPNQSTEAVKSGNDKIKYTRKESELTKENQLKSEGSKERKEGRKESNEISKKKTDDREEDNKEKDNIEDKHKYEDVKRNLVDQDAGDKISESETINIYRMSDENVKDNTEGSIANNKKDKMSENDLNKVGEEMIVDEETAKSSVSDFFTQKVYPKLGVICGFLLVLGAFVIIGNFVWSQTVLLYCYNGGEEYRKLGILHLKREKKEFKLFLPEYMLDEAETPRYRLLIHKSLVKRNRKMDIVLQSEDHKLRQPIEECMDFVL